MDPCYVIIILIMACRVTNLSSSLLQLNDSDDDGGIGSSDSAFGQSDDTCAADPPALADRAYSLPGPGELGRGPRGAGGLGEGGPDGNSPSSHPTTLRATAISPSSISTPLMAELAVRDSDSGSQSDSESYSSSSSADSTMSGSHHNQAPDSLPRHAQRAQHACRFELDTAQTQLAMAGQSCNLCLITHLPDITQGLSPTEAGEAGTQTATSADSPHGVAPQTAAAATACLTAQHIRQLYPHLFGSTAPSPANNAVKRITSEHDLRDVLSMAAGRIALVAAPHLLAPFIASHASADSPAGAASMFDADAVESATCSAAVVSQEQGSCTSLAVGHTGSLRAGQGALQQRLHAAALHDSPLRQLLQEADAAPEDAIQAGM